MNFGSWRLEKRSGSFSFDKIRSMFDASKEYRIKITAPAFAY